MAWKLETYDSERLAKHANGNAVIGIVRDQHVEYNWLDSSQHAGDVLRILVRYYRTPVAVEQLRLYMQKHSYFTLAPRVSMCEGSRTGTPGKMDLEGWNNGTNQWDKSPGAYGIIFMHSDNCWKVRDHTDRWVDGATLFAKVPA